MMVNHEIPEKPIWMSSRAFTLSVLVRLSLVFELNYAKLLISTVQYPSNEFKWFNLIQPWGKFLRHGFSLLLTVSGAVFRVLHGSTTTHMRGQCCSTSPFYASVAAKRFLLNDVTAQESGRFPLFSGTRPAHPYSLKCIETTSCQKQLLDWKSTQIASETKGLDCT